MASGCPSPSTSLAKLPDSLAKTEMVYTVLEDAFLNGFFHFSGLAVDFGWFQFATNGLKVFLSGRIFLSATC